MPALRGAATTGVGYDDLRTDEQRLPDMKVTIRLNHTAFVTPPLGEKKSPLSRGGKMA
jgi:hypothetical protein